MSDLKQHEEDYIEPTPDERIASLLRRAPKNPAAAAALQREYDSLSDELLKRQQATDALLEACNVDHSATIRPVYVPPEPDELRAEVFADPPVAWGTVLMDREAYSARLASVRQHEAYQQARLSVTKFEGQKAAVLTLRSRVRSLEKDAAEASGVLEFIASTQCIINLVEGRASQSDQDEQFIRNLNRVTEREKEGVAKTMLSSSKMVSTYSTGVSVTTLAGSSSIRLLPAPPTKTERRDTALGNPTNGDPALFQRHLRHLRAMAASALDQRHPISDLGACQRCWRQVREKAQECLAMIESSDQQRHLRRDEANKAYNVVTRLKAEDFIKRAAE